MAAQILYNGYEIGEVTCPTKYFEEASSINFSRSVTYGLGIIRVSFLYFLSKRGIAKSKLFGRKKWFDLVQIFRNEFSCRSGMVNNAEDRNRLICMILHDPETSLRDWDDMGGYYEAIARLSLPLQYQPSNKKQVKIAQPVTESRDWRFIESNRMWSTETVRPS